MCVRVLVMLLSIFAKASALVIKESYRKSVDNSVNKMTERTYQRWPVASSIAMKIRIFINVPCRKVAF